MSWTAEELQSLKALADQGLSAGQIASHLPGKTRNAVIGMLKRGKGQYGRLMHRPGPPALRTALKAPPPLAPVEVLFHSPPCVGFSKPLATRSIPEAKASEDNGSIASDRDDEVGTAAPGDASRARGGADTAPSNLPATLPITFLQAVLTDRCLHYACAPFDPDGPDMPVCGQPRAANVVGTRYCRRHLALRAQVAA